MIFLKKWVMPILFMASVFAVNAQQKNTIIEGVIIDGTEMTIPYAAITILNKNYGTSSTEEGGFSLAISKEFLSDTLMVSSIGFETQKIKISEFISRKNKSIVLKENITKLSTVELLNAEEYAKRALKSLKKNTVSSRHQLKVLYRRSSVEDGKSRFFVEHYLDVIDYGPSLSSLQEINVLEGRKSADYRFFKEKQPTHSIFYMANRNPLREGINLRNYKWSKKGDSSYDNEDIVIIEGKEGAYKYVRLYIGVETYGIYKVESSDLNSVYVYKKNTEGKLYLSYHNREWKFNKDLSKQQKQFLKNSNQDKIELAYRHEAFVLDIETNRKNIKANNDIVPNQDMGDMKVPYNPELWKDFNVPPDTQFFKKIKLELESLYGVPLGTQFNLVN